MHPAEASVSFYPVVLAVRQPTSIRDAGDCVYTLSCERTRSPTETRINPLHARAESALSPRLLRPRGRSSSTYTRPSRHPTRPASLSAPWIASRANLNLRFRGSSRGINPPGRRRRKRRESPLSRRGGISRSREAQLSGTSLFVRPAL